MEKLNEGRDLRKECKKVVLESLKNAEPGDGYSILKAVEPWVGMFDSLFTSLGKYPGTPVRPDGPYLGFSDALLEIDPKETDDDHLVTLLSLSFKNKKRIPAYSEFFKKTEDRFKSTHPDSYQAILRGFKPDPDE